MIDYLDTERRMRIPNTLIKEGFKEYEKVIITKGKVYERINRKKLV